MLAWCMYRLMLVVCGAYQLIDSVCSHGINDVEQKLQSENN
jgi:hypothetical protein